MEQKKRFFIPKYAFIPLAAVVIINFAVYNGAQWIAAEWPHHSLTLDLDAAIPFCPAFIVIYVLAYLQWCISYIMIARDGREVCYRIVAGDIVAKLICLVIFLAYPTTMDRPEITGTGLWETLVGIIYQFDAPVNLFPSIHCLASWVCFRAARMLTKPGPWYTAVMFVFTLLVCASTVLVKQHVALDIIGGIAVAEIGLFVAGKCRLGRVFMRLEPPFVKKSLHGAGDKSPE